MTAREARIRDMEMALRAALASTYPEVHLEWKAMFGGAGFFVNGLIFAAWFGGELALKLPVGAAAELLTVPGSARAQAREYIETPAVFLDDPTQLEPWVARSVDYVTAQGVKKKHRH